MHRNSPITNPVILEKSTDTRNWQLNAELLVNASTLAFFIYWLKKGAESVWSFVGLRYFFAPLAALGSLLAAIFSIRQALLRQDAHSISSAVIEVLAAGATIVAAIAIIGSIAALAIVGPLLLTAAVALKTLFNLGSAIGYAMHFFIEKKPDMKVVYRTKAFEHLVDGVLGSIITAAALTLILVAAPVIPTVLAAFAVVASAFSIVHYVAKAAKNPDRNKAEAHALKNKEQSYTSMLQKLDNNPQADFSYQQVEPVTDLMQLSNAPLQSEVLNTEPQANTAPAALYLP